MRYFYFLFIFFLFLYNCEEEKNVLQYETLEFVDEFFKLNSETIFNDEIERVKLNYFEPSNILIYTFKNREKIDNGSLFLRLYPQDSSYLTEKRKKLGSMNLSIAQKEIFELNSKRNFLIKKLQFPYKIKSIATGNYVDGKNKWLADYKALDLLYPESTTKTPIDEQKIILKLFANNAPRYKIEKIGPKVFSDKKKKIEVYYNCNKQRLTTYFGKVNDAKVNGKYNINFNINETTYNKEIDLNTILKDGNIGLSIVDFTETASLKSFTISQKNWKKKIDVYNLIHYTHVKGITPKNVNALNLEDRSFTIIDYILSNTLKNIYTEPGVFDVYVNGSNKSFYVIGTKKRLKQNIVARVYSTDSIFTKGKAYKDLEFKNKKTLRLTKKNEVLQLFHLRMPYLITKVEFGILSKEQFKTFYTFDK